MKSIGNTVGLVGWRGMVGSVLMDRMQAEGDFDLIEPIFFSTSNAGGKAPAMAKNEKTLKDAHDIDALKKCDVIITAQGGRIEAISGVHRGADCNGAAHARLTLNAGRQRSCWPCATRLAPWHRWFG